MISLANVWIIFETVGYQVESIFNQKIVFTPTNKSFLLLQTWTEQNERHNRCVGWLSWPQTLVRLFTHFGFRKHFRHTHTQNKAQNLFILYWSLCARQWVATIRLIERVFIFLFVRRDFKQNGFDNMYRDKKNYVSIHVSCVRDCILYLRLWFCFVVRLTF